MKSVAVIVASLWLFSQPVSAQTGGSVAEFFSMNTFSRVLPVESGVWTASGGALLFWNTLDGSYRTYTSEDGLPTGNCSSILQAPDGSVWTVFDDRYVVRYDGSSWDAMEECPANGKFIRAFQFGPDGDAIFWTYDGIYRQSGDAWLLISLEGCIPAAYSMFVAPNGDIWMTSLTWCIDNCPTSGYGAARYDGESWEIFDTHNGLLDKRTVEIGFSDDGRVFVLSMGGLSIFDGTAWVWDDTFGSGSSREGPSRKLAVLPDGTVWIAGREAVYRRRNGNWSIFTAADMHISEVISTMYPDADGRIWVCTYEGVSMFDGAEWAVRADDRAWGARIFDPIAQGPDGTVWVASTNGLYSWNGDDWNVYRTGGPSQTPSGDVASSPSGDIWGESGVVSRYRAGKWTNYTREEGLPSNALYCLDVDDEGNVWVGTYEGLAVYDGDSWRTFTTDDGLDVNWITTIGARSPDDIWVNYERAHIGHFDGEEWTTYDFAEEHSYTHLYAVDYDTDGGAWLAAGGYIFYIHDGEWTTWDSGNGIQNFRAQNIAVGAPGQTWAEIDYHLARLNGDSWEFYEVSPGVFTGSLSNRITALAVDSAGAVWCGTEDGIIHIIDGGDYRTLRLDMLTGIGGLSAKLIEPDRGRILATGGTRTVIYTWSNGTYVSGRGHIPAGAALLPNIPNPFNPSTLIPFTLADDSHVTVSIYDAAGRLVTELVDDYLSAGDHQARWDAADAASGVYICRLTAGNTVYARKMTLVR